MSTIKFVAPFGPCAICIKQFAEGFPARKFTLRDGRELVAGYCSHVEAGFFGVAEGGELNRWTLKCPIPIEEWHEYVRALPATIAGVQDGIADRAAEDRGALN